MTQRNKLELPLNVPTKITLLYDEPVSGQSKYGSYHLFAVSVGDDEFSFFPSEEIVEKIRHLKRGDSFTITKLAANRNGKLVTSYDVKLLTKEVKLPVTQTAEANHEEEDLSPAPHDNFFYTMLNSYRDALEISRELNGLVDVHRCSITLYLSRCKQSNY